MNNLILLATGPFTEAVELRATTTISVVEKWSRILQLAHHKTAVHLISAQTGRIDVLDRIQKIHQVPRGDGRRSAGLHTTRGVRVQEGDYSNHSTDPVHVLLVGDPM